jgi:hypothetical protein
LGLQGSRDLVLVLLWDLRQGLTCGSGRTAVEILLPPARDRRRIVDVRVELIMGGKVNQADTSAYGVCLRADEIVQSVDRVGIDEAVACPLGSRGTVRRRSVSHFNEDIETHFSHTFTTTSRRDGPTGPHLDTM